MCASVALGGRLIEPVRRRLAIARHALTELVADAERELGFRKTLARALLVQLRRARNITRNTVFGLQHFPERKLRRTATTRRGALVPSRRLPAILRQPHAPSVHVTDDRHRT